MDKAERLKAHSGHGGWMPDPKSHLNSPRDAFHCRWALKAIEDIPVSKYGAPTSILDVGCYDGWLDFLIMNEGYDVEGVEIVSELCESARMFAKAHDLNYKIHNGFFDDVVITRNFDVVFSFETIEHIPLDMVASYVTKMEAIATQRILISLPDQRMEDNAQHLWTPSYELILNMFGRKKNFQLTYKPYHGTDIPANFLFSWDK